MKIRKDNVIKVIRNRRGLLFGVVRVFHPHYKDYQGVVCYRLSKCKSGEDKGDYVSWGRERVLWIKTDGRVLSGGRAVILGEQ